MLQKRGEFDDVDVQPTLLLKTMHEIVATENLMEERGQTVRTGGDVEIHDVVLPIKRTQS